MNDPRLDDLTAEGYAALLAQVEEDYAQGRIVVRPDGWIVSLTEWRRLDPVAGAVDSGGAPALAD